MLLAGLASERGGSRGATASMSEADAVKEKTPRFKPPSLQEIAAEFPNLEVIEVAGVGGMGVVYKVMQKELGRVVALKILPSEIASDPSFTARFSQEARALATLSHPNVVHLYDAGESENYYFLLMEYVDGINLREAIREGNLKPEEALSIVPQVCEALQFAHSNGIVHRDIKPENILIDKQGVVKVADFGLAKLVDADLNLTATQQVMGTLHYMAPEQVRQTSDVDHRADLYSLGVVFYEMLTGQLPLGKFALPSDATSVHPSVDSVVLRTLENEPDQRYQSATEMQSDIASVKWKPVTTSQKLESKATLMNRLFAWLRLPAIFFVVVSVFNFGWAMYTQLMYPISYEDRYFGLILFFSILSFVAPIVMFVAGWMMLKRQPKITLLRCLVVFVLLNSLYFSPAHAYGFWVSIATMFGYYPEGYAQGDSAFFMWCLRTLLFSLVGIATTIFAVVALVRLFSRTARDLNRIQIAEQDSMLLSSIAQLSKQDRREAKLQLKLPSTLMMLAGVVGLGFAGFVFMVSNIPGMHGYSALYPFAFVSIPFSIWAFVAGVCLRLPKGFRFCKAAGWVVFIPTSPVYPLFLFAGIMTVLVLGMKPVQRLMLEKEGLLGRREP